MEQRLTLADFMLFCSVAKKIELTPDDKLTVVKGRATLEKLQEFGSVYGANTGVGPFLNEAIHTDTSGEFQRQLLLSHATGTGCLLSRQEARGMMFLLINMARKGYSGISLPTLEFLIELSNRDIIPAIPCQGSLGASGDLAPLAHLALLLIGEGNILPGNSVAVPTKFSWEFEKGIVKPIQLQSGEALALINGTHLMTCLLARAVYKAKVLAKSADIIGALTCFALHGNLEAFDREIHRLRPHHGQKHSAINISLLFGDIKNEEGSCLQDAYSLRCIPQVHGAAKDIIRYVGETVEVELNSVTCNPLFIGGKVYHGGNFHGHPLALSADFLAIALTTLGGISERRIERLLNPTFSNGLLAFLRSENKQGDYGFGMAQVTASALVSENKVRSHPASVDSIPTGLGQEDFVSMGALAARKANEVLVNTQKVLAIELLAAIRALEIQEGELREYPWFVREVYDCIDWNCFQEDWSSKIESAFRLIDEGVLLQTVEKRIPLE